MGDLCYTFKVLRDFTVLVKYDTITKRYREVEHVVLWLNVNPHTTSQGSMMNLMQRPLVYWLTWKKDSQIRKGTTCAAGVLCGSTCSDEPQPDAQLSATCHQEMRGKKKKKKGRRRADQHCLCGLTLVRNSSIDNSFNWSSYLLSHRVVMFILYIVTNEVHEKEVVELGFNTRSV